MTPNLLIADVNAARTRDLLAEAQQHRRTVLFRRGRAAETTVRSAARWVTQIRALRGGAEPAAA